MRRRTGAVKSTTERSAAVDVAGSGDAASQLRIGHFLRRLAHDVGGSIGAICLEIDSLRYLAGEIATIAASGDHTAAQAMQAELLSVAENLASVQRDVSRKVGDMRQIGREWTEERGEEARP